MVVAINVRPFLQAGNPRIYLIATRRKVRLMRSPTGRRVFGSA
jgi:hypothetical protein